jgi:hypothetical protein
MELRPKGKALFFTLSICLVFSLFFAETLAVDDLDHDCIGEGCPFCLVIETAHNFFKSLKLAALTVFLIVCLMFLIQTLNKFNNFFFFLNSPITLKVRFNS